MMDKKALENVLNTALNTPDLKAKKPFVVNFSVSSDNSINIAVDAYEGITVEDCTMISRAIRTAFDQDEENYDLTVSSAGLTEPFKVPEQYKKALGKELKIQTADGKRYKGKLTEYGDTHLTLAVKSNKKKQIINESIALDEIKSAKQVISF